MLFATAGLAALGLLMTTGEYISKGFDLPWLELLFPMLGIGVVSAFAGWVNQSWAKSLPEHSAPERQRKLNAWDILALLASTAAVAVLSYSMHRDSLPQYGEHVDRAHAPASIPAGATDISYCQGVRGTIAYEFTIDEAGFREWVAGGIGSIESQSANIPLKTITTPVAIGTYSRLSEELTGPELVTVEAGLYYSWSHEDRGVTAVFDSKRNRAYYAAHFH